MTGIPFVLIFFLFLPRDLLLSALLFYFALMSRHIDPHLETGMGEILRTVLAHLP